MTAQRQSAPGAGRSARRRAFSLVELLMAALITAIVAAGAVATWSFSSRAAGNKRATEIGTAIAVEEMERLKAMRYPYLPASALQGGQPVPTVRWYDNRGNWLGIAAVTGAFRAESTVTILIDRDSETNSEDLKEIRISVWDTNRVRSCGTARTLLKFGGV
ncbi:MAG: type II secretion system protein [Armatimonadetes bacterium]|nr:type II secretion system protein [Armatimonadota bacterium]